MHDNRYGKLLQRGLSVTIIAKKFLYDGVPRQAAFFQHLIEAESVNA